MFQSKVLFEANTYNSSIREGNQRLGGVKPFNSTLFPEGEGVTATCLGNLFVFDRSKEINRKNAPNELSNCNNYKTKRVP